jgi:tRNA A37 threonylcarbamoyladenosine synthetase subunit TsaC/SUA5/YrdC
MILGFQTDDEITTAIPQVVRHLRAGKLLAYPTETVYGLGSAPTASAVVALARLKGRPEGKPFLLLISGRRMAEEWRSGGWSFRHPPLHCPRRSGPDR